MSKRNYNYHHSNSPQINFKSGTSPVLSFKIDSGASKTILPARLFKQFKPNTDIKSGKETRLVSASGHEFSGYEHTVFVALEGSYRVLLKTIFCDTEKCLFGLDSIRDRLECITFNKNQFSITFIA